MVQQMGLGLIIFAYSRVVNTAPGWWARNGRPGFYGFEAQLFLPTAWL